MSESSSPATGQNEKSRVLLVDDEPDITRALQRELRSEPYQVTAFNDSQQALGAASAQEFALVISDNLMPGMTGIELLGNLKVARPDTRRVLLTGHTDLNRAIQAFNDGDIHRYIGKPWDTEELRLVIRQELRIYRESKEQELSRERIEAKARLHTSKLQEVFVELREARTQIAMYEEGSSPHRPRISARMKRLSILVVDEHDGVREILVSTLKKAGIANIAGIAGGAQALEFLAASPSVDVILSEWKLTDINGFELYNQIRLGHSLSAAALFFFVTTQAHQSSVKTAIESGANGYLIKPFHLKTLLDLIESRLPKGDIEVLEERIQSLRDLYFVVVNADLESRSILQNILVASGIRDVATAPSGHMGVRLLEEREPDVVIYDCNVRDPYWLELHARWQAGESGVRTPVLIVTSATPVEKEFADVTAAGVRSFLPGKVQRRKLLQMILEELRSRGD